MDDAIDFYQNTLGLKCLNRYGDHYAEMQAPDMLIALHMASSKVKKGNNMSIGFGVTDFDDTLELLVLKGVDFKKEDEGYIRLAHFTDMDDNALFLAER